MGPNCRISKVKFKNGTNLTILPKSNAKKTEIFLGDWGIVTCLILNDPEDKTEGIKNRDTLYMLEAAKQLITQ